MNSEERINGTAENTGQGYLIVHVTTARGSIPLEGAQVNVRNYYPDLTPERGDVIASLTTNRDGNTEPFPLPAPPRSNSVHPDSGNAYASYNLDVYMEGYFAQNYINVPVFDGITAIQPVDMIPLPENGRTDSRTPDSERFLETPPHNLQSTT